MNEMNEMNETNGMNGLPRGVRNRNPGNIRRSKTRYKGEVESRDPAFKSFRTMAWGYRAMFVLLHTYRVRYGIDTLRGMISRWAPPTENHTDNYLTSVARDAGQAPDDPIDTLDGECMCRIVEAMSRVENGVAARREEVSEGWRLVRADF